MQRIVFKEDPICKQFGKISPQPNLRKGFAYPLIHKKSEYNLGTKDFTDKKCLSC